MHRVRTTTGFLAIAFLATALWPTAGWAVALKPLNAVSFSDTNRGVIAGAPNAVDGLLSWTSNAGVSWHATVVKNHFFVGVRAASAGGAVTALAGEPLDGVYKSSDYGRSWTQEAPIFGEPAALWGVEYLSGNRRVVVGKLHPSNNSAVIGSSVSEGAWNTDFIGPYHPGPTPDDPPLTTNAELAGVDAAPGGAVAWAIGNDWTVTGNAGTYDPLVYKWSNSGSTWTTQTAGGAGALLKCVAAADATHAFVGRANRTLLRTRDGSVWAADMALPVAWGTSPVNAVDAVDANHVIVVGNAGKIAWTSNASDDVPTWLMNTETAPNDLLGAEMIDLNNWIVVGDNETIWRTANAGVSWTGSKSAVKPSVAITTDGSHLLDSATVGIAGTSSDAGIGVERVEVRIQNANGKYWDGSGWVTPDTWFAAAPVNPAQGFDSWQASASLPSTASAGGSLTAWARAYDGYGLEGNAPSIGAAAPSGIALSQTIITIGYKGTAAISGVLTSGGLPVGGADVSLWPAQAPYAPATKTDASGHFSFQRAPSAKTVYTLNFGGDAQHKPVSAQLTVIPQVKLSTPAVPRTVRHTNYAKFYSDLNPKHASGGKITFTFQRLQKVRGKNTWVTKKTVSAKLATYRSWSRATVKVRLPAGKSWRVQTKHSDSDHATSYSSQRGFRVR